MVLHRGGINVRANDRAFGIDVHLYDDRQTVRPFAQRRVVRGQRLRQHREDSRARIDGARIRSRVLVERRATVHERFDVGDPHPNTDVSRRELLRDLDLVEVARFVVVDRRPRERAKIAHAGADQARGLEPGGFFERQLREVGDEARLEHCVPRPFGEIELLHYSTITYSGFGSSPITSAGGITLPPIRLSSSRNSLNPGCTPGPSSSSDRCT